MDIVSMEGNIRKIRERLGLSQLAMAEKMNVVRTAYRNLETGKTGIFSKAALRFMQASGCSVSELVFGTSVPLNDNGTLMQESDFEEMRKTLTDDYERRLKELDDKLEASRNLLSERERTIEAMQKTISSLDSMLKRLEKELSTTPSH